MRNIKLFNIRHCQAKFLILLSSVLLISMFAAEGAYAQRGGKASGHPSDFTTPTQGFPGFFDTNFAEPGSLVVEFPPIILPFIPIPSVAIDYGLTDRFTIGTNALVTGLPWLLGAAGGTIKARALVYGNDRMQSAATFYAGLISSGSFSTSWQVFTSNNAWKIAPKHVLSGQLMFMNFGLELGKESSLEYTNIRFSSAGIGGGYQFIVNDTSAISTYFLAPAWTALESDTVAASMNANMDVRSGELVWGLARASVDIRSNEWVYSLGGMYFQGVRGISPWLSATTRW